MNLNDVQIICDTYHDSLQPWGLLGLSQLRHQLFCERGQLLLAYLVGQILQGFFRHQPGHLNKVLYHVMLSISTMFYIVM